MNMPQDRYLLYHPSLPDPAHTAYIPQQSQRNNQQSSVAKAGKGLFNIVWRGGPWVAAGNNINQADYLVSISGTNRVQKW